MLKKCIMPISFAAMLIACGDDSSSNSSSGVDNESPTPTQKSSSSTTQEPVGCSFEKNAKVWEFSENFMGLRDVYTWQDETTVKHEVWMNAYHMDEDDELLTDVDRDDLYKKVMEECESYNKDSSEPAFAAEI